jgi:hypothetical protein
MPRASKDQTVRPAPADVDAAAHQPLDVVVPFLPARMVPVAPDRVRQLRRHLVETMRGARSMSARSGRPKPEPPEPGAFVLQVLRAGCALCQGYCCRTGDTHAYIDDDSMRRVRRDHPDADAWGILRRYLACVPQQAQEGSCIFHGERGCTLPRDLRGNLCNSYHCNGLQRVLDVAPPPGRVRLQASRGDRIGGSLTLQAPA